MRRAIERPLIAALLLLLAPGCTILRVTRVRLAGQEVETAWHFWLNPVNLWNEATSRLPEEPETDARGLRFFLPKPYLLVTPNAAGGIDVETVFLPDPAQQYAVESRVYIASQNFNLTLADGMLQKISYKPDQTAVLNRLFEAGGNVGAEIVTKQGELAKAEAEEAKTQAEAEAKQRAEKAAALAKARAELQQLHFATAQAERALADFDALHPAPTPEQLAQRQKLEAAVREARFAEKQKAAEVARLEGSRMQLQFEAETPPERSIAVVPGPALFEIVEVKGGGVHLQGVGFGLDPKPPIQEELRTYRPKAPGEPDPLSLRQGPSAPVAATGPSYVVDFVFSTSVAEGSLSVEVRGPAAAPASRFLQRGPPTAQQKLTSYYLVDGAKLSLVLASTDHVAGQYGVAVVSSANPGSFKTIFELR